VIDIRLSVRAFALLRRVFFGGETDGLQQFR